MKKEHIFRTIIRDYTLHILLVIGAASVSNGVLYIGNKDGQIYAFGL